MLILRYDKGVTRPVRVRIEILVTISTNFQMPPHRDVDRNGDITYNYEEDTPSKKEPLCSTHSGSFLSAFIPTA